MITFISKYSTQIDTNTKITLFGFSQGGAAASRWFVNSDLPNASLILWGSFPPPDIDYNKLRKKLSDPVKIIIGDNDEFISEDRLNKELKTLQREKINIELKKYPGRHNIQPGLLKKLELFN
ncbi:MAG: dienelactone hydrolase family protein [Melioribacteraceae bacterium]|nr:dienelactone hydrolase family protein [Melioribacteraceae bacterium]